MKTKKQAHTPGPWYADTGGYPIIINAGNPEQPRPGCIVCTIEDPTSPSSFTAKRDDRNAANARLIAAAPDLLAACREMVDAIERCKNYAGLKGYYNMGRAAIAKAEGQAVRS